MQKKIGSRLGIICLLLVTLLTGSVMLNFSLFNYSRLYYFQLNDLRLDPLNLEFFPMDEPQTETLNSETTHVVFFGDSRAANWPSPSLDGFKFTNRGIGSQTSVQVLQRYSAHVQPLYPDILVIQVCINDLKTIPLFPEKKSDIIMDCKNNIQQIIGLAREQGAMVIITTVFPVGEYPIQRRIFWSEDIPLAIKDVNIFIKSLADDKVVVFDTFAILADENGRLRDMYQIDELHLNSAGYDAINQEFVSLLKTIRE